jgi:outer membrane lipoprotein-sorting protein
MAPWLVVWLIACAAEPDNTALAPDLHAELREIAERAANVKDVTVTFEQQRFTPLLKKPLISSGRVLIAGRRVRWETARPFPSVALMEEAELRIYYPQHKTLEVYPLDERLGELAASPLPRLDDLLERFEIHKLASEDERQIGLKLTPRDPELRKHLASVTVRVDRRTGLASSVEWTDGSRERTAIAFTDARVNTGLDEAAMDLKISAGTKVVHPLGRGRGGPGGAEGGERR